METYCRALYIPAIGQGDLPDCWPVHTGHQTGRPPWLMAGTYQPSGRETFLINGWYPFAIGQGELPDWWPVHPAIVGETFLIVGQYYRALGRSSWSMASTSSPNGWYKQAIKKRDLPAQWLVCTGHRAGRSHRPMAGMYQPLIREASPPDGQYVPAIDQEGLPAQWPVCTGHWLERSPRPMNHIFAKREKKQVITKF